MTNKEEALALAIKLAVDRLAEKSDLPARCARLGLSDPAAADGTVHLPFLGRTLALRPPVFAASVLETGLAAKPADRLLALHYLLCDTAVQPEGNWISFRDFPGGAFYWQPFLSRTIQPLIASVGNDLDLLRTRLARLSARLEAGPADGLAARIAAVGRVDALLVYHAGDAEFPAAADLLFDACCRRVFCAEDAAALASRICLSLV
ncbi:MAG: DUF3786 domain-containing protein [Kiritimatiellae bacterium]|nr:DUF3786 domain-containing protein [Kiritimatiellia bacterium]